MKSCDKFRDQFSEYIDDELRGEGKDRLEEHIHQCGECDQILARMSKLGDRMCKMEPVSTTNTFQFVLRSRIRREMESESFLEKIFTIFQTNRIPALGLSMAALLLLTYVSVDIYNHIFEPASAATTTAAVQDQQPSSIKYEDLVLTPDSPRERINYVLEEISGEAVDSEIGSTDLHQPWLTEGTESVSDRKEPAPGDRIVRTVQSTTVTF